MKAYILAATGICFFTVLLSFLLPEGKVGKTIQFVMRIACIVCLLQPILGLFNGQNSIAEQSLCDYSLVCSLYEANQEQSIKESILKEFGEEVECDVVIEYQDGNFSQEKVSITLKRQDEEIEQKIYAYLEGSGYINILIHVEVD
jgi:hypothetical protein